MALLDILAAANVSPVGGKALAATFNILTPGEYSGFGVSPLADRARRQNPLVSCMMVTTGERSTIRHALECYRRQQYRRRELVVVTHPDGLDRVTGLVAASGAADVAIHAVGREMTLGDCRNVAIARARGDIVMQWDDDDLSDPLRVSVAAAMLMQSPAAAVMLSRVLVWWPQRRLAAISERRFWEGSIAVWREHAPAYPSLAMGEDTVAVENLRRTRVVATYDMPLLYFYTVHARNTWDRRHFERIIELAEHRIEGADYAELMRMFAERAPAAEYQAETPPEPVGAAQMAVLDGGHP